MNAVLTVITTAGQNGLESNDNEEVLSVPQNSKFEASPSRTLNGNTSQH